uniref:Uncharacterized protein n=1 Tax=Equus asinus TaxID=9793 RepID=A0A9L0IZ83_EQUAS
MPAALLFFLKTALPIQGLLWFHRHFRIVCSTSVKNAIGILIGISLNLQIALGNMDTLTILILPIHEHRIFSHLFVSSSISFIHVIYFSVYRSFISLVNFIPRYFILFDAIIDGIFSISLSHGLLLVYRNTSEFCILILYPATLLNSFINSNSF